jgi:hypothetical protein
MLLFFLFLLIAIVPLLRAMRSMFLLTLLFLMLLLFFLFATSFLRAFAFAHSLIIMIYIAANDEFRQEIYTKSDSFSEG